MAGWSWLRPGVCGYSGVVLATMGWLWLPWGVDCIYIALFKIPKALYIVCVYVCMGGVMMYHGLFVATEGSSL